MEKVWRFMVEDAALWEAVKAGEQRGTFEMAFDVECLINNDRVCSHEVRSFPLSVTVLHAGEHSVKGVNRAEMRQVMSEAISGHVRLTEAWGEVIGHQVDVKSLPENIACQVALMSAGQTLSEGEFCWRKGAGNCSVWGPVLRPIHAQPRPWPGYAFPLGFSGGYLPVRHSEDLPAFLQRDRAPLEMVFTPSRRAAERTVDIETYWDGELQVEVKVEPVQ